jgi:beta-galactosidase
MVTQDRAIKKDVYFFYQANWATEPMVYITSRRLVQRTQPTTEIKIYSNCPAVDLNVNGKPLPAVQGDKVHVFRWENVKLQPGDNQIQATATANGKTVQDKCAWTLR